MTRGQITRDTPFPTQMGKWGVKGIALRDLPDKFLSWYAEDGQFDDWREACGREIEERAESPNGTPPKAKAKGVPIPLQSDHMLVSLGLIEENYILVKQSLGREPTSEAAQAHADTVVINLSRNPHIDWELVEKEQRQLHKDLTSKK